MRVFPRLILTTLLAVTILAGANSPASTLAATSGIYIALGDSIAAGSGSSLPLTRGCVAVVGQRLQRLRGRSVSVENLAVPGETADTFLNGGQLARFQQRVSDATAAGVPVVAVSVSLGGNDMLSLEASDQQQRQAGLDGFRTSYASAVQAIRSTVGASVPIVVTTYYDLSEGDAGVPDSDAWWLSQFNAVIKDVAAKESATVADVTPVFAGHITEYTLKPVDVHPTNAGHAAIADAVWKALGVDTSAPMIEAPTEISATRLTPTVRFKVTDDDVVAHVQVMVDAGAVSQPLQVGDGSYAALLDFRGIAESSVVVTIQSEDFAGNVSSETVDVGLPAGG